MITSRTVLTLLAGAFAVSFIAPAFAEPAARHTEASKEQSSEAARLPAAVTTDPSVHLPDRTLRFKATAVSIPINNAEGKLQAQIAFIAYVRPEVEAGARPLTFVF